MSAGLNASRVAPWAAIFLALLFYVIGLGSDHLATGGDELVYAQMTRLTAASGRLLPLQSADETLRNTKPPLLFWQGILSTGWGRDWSLSRLRGPSVLYTLLTGGLLVLLGARRLGSLPLGLSAAALFLCFFSTYRYGRVYMTSAPETFFLFAPLALLLLRDEEGLPRGGLQPLLMGLMVGLALLYKSFALVIPFAATIALWDLRGRKWQWRPFLVEDAWKIAVVGVVAMLTFGLWFFLDPHPWQVFTDFVLRENVGKLSNDNESYLLNFLWGPSSFWRILVSYPLNAGLLAPPVIALAADAWARRKQLDSLEILLWIWILVLAAFFCIPNQRDERYLIPAMPAIALLLAMRLDDLPRWTILISLAASAAITAGLIGLGLLLQHDTAAGILYPWWALLVPIAGLLVCLKAFACPELSRPLLAPAILLAYLSYATFLIPLDRDRGLFDAGAIRSVAGREVFVPSNFNAREESYGFLLPGAQVKPYKYGKRPPDKPFVVVSLPLNQAPPAGIILGKRLNMIDRFKNAQLLDMLAGNLSHHMFHWDWLVQKNPTQ